MPDPRCSWAGSLVLRGRGSIVPMSYSSALSLASCEADDGKRAGSVTQPDNSSETARERLSSSSLSLTQNKIMSLAAAEGR